MRSGESYHPRHCSTVNSPPFPISKVIIPVSLALADLVAVIISTSVVNELLIAAGPQLPAAKALLMTALLIGLPLALFLKSPRRSSGDVWPHRLSGAIFWIAISAYGLLIAVGPLSVTLPAWALGLMTYAALTCFVFRTAISRLLLGLHRRGRIQNATSLIGGEVKLRPFVKWLANIKLVQFILPSVAMPALAKAGRRPGTTLSIGGAEGFSAIGRSNLVHDIALAMSTAAEPSPSRILARADAYLDRGFAPAAESTASTRTTIHSPNREAPSVDGIQHRSTAGWPGVAKSTMDYFFASALLVVLAPVLVLIAVLIKLESPGPVIFCQERHGLNFRKFQIWKFRTMYHRDVPETDVRQCSRDDPRVTPLGRFLRRTSLDELPQIYNVLNGTMSLVGPRPHALCHNAEYGKLIRNYNKRNFVKPGITGWAQVNGFRGETRTVASMARRIEKDLVYVDNWSVAFDLRILFATPFVVLFQDTAY